MRRFILALLLISSLALPAVAEAGNQRKAMEKLCDRYVNWYPPFVHQKCTWKYNKQETARIRNTSAAAAAFGGIMGGSPVGAGLAALLAAYASQAMDTDRCVMVWKHDTVYGVSMYSGGYCQ